MELKPEQLFTFMEVAYRQGVIDKVMPLVGQSLEKLKANSGLTMDDLLNKLDGAAPESIEKLNKVLNWSPPLLRLAGNDILMSLLSKMLSIQMVQHMTVWVMEKYFAHVLAKSDGTLPTLSEKLKGLSTKIAGKEPVASSRAVGS